MADNSLATTSAAPSVPRSAIAGVVASTARMWSHVGLNPLILWYAATLFVSAFLLFWLQPLVAKMLLPRLGGAPAVWNTALMFFQLILLAGYLYAHILNHYVATKAQPWVHGAVLLIAFTFLPLDIGTSSPAPDDAPSVWLIQRLALCVGLPFFALSASAPLLQTWFARTAHRHAQDPYFLYGSSNLGSLLALIGFPLVFEPWLTVAHQSRLWMLLFVAFVALLVGCALLSPRSATPDPVTAAPQSRLASRVAAPWREWLLWIALAFVPSSLLLGVTSYIAADVASAPLLWIAPLALYLLSFVIVFSRRPIISLSWLLAGQAIAISIVLLLFLPLPAPSLALVIGAHFAAFFFTALVCHGALAVHRPAAARLTEFYICMSLGGAMGGIANALIAPAVFSAAYEYPLALVVACVLRKAATTTRQRLRLIDLAAPLCMLAVMATMLSTWDLLGRISPLHAPGLLHQERSFFGVYRVKLDADAPVVDLSNGTTIHGAEAIEPARWREELRYYHPAGPVGRYFATLRDASPGRQRVGVIGLGTGALACYAQSGDDWSFYEIDPVVVRLARDTRYFHYLEQCGAADRIVLGDARISLAREPQARYDLLILDAFSSDAIPMHLLTREALQLYLAKLSEHGTILLHISNTHLKLWPMLDSLARELGLVTRHWFFIPTPAEAADTANPSEWLALARADADLAFLDGTTPGWKNEHPTKNVVGWSDDFSNLLSVIHW